ncbi:MAG: hypothetical protein GY851_14060, partial [bacterium]|nr:hypothetical protein [bacterium]
GDIGMYRVGYQSYGGEVVEMPVSWTGHFTTESGISYVPNLPRMGRDVVFIHSPWKVTPGKAWVDYRLRLPETGPVALSFGIAMKEDSVIPGRSDGVTFSCVITEGGQARELMREHQATADWKDFQFDLTSYAGRTVTLRLRVEPGPENSPSWDYSYFGDATIVCGSEAEGKTDLLATLTSTKACRAVADVDLRVLSNDPGKGIVPSNALPFRNHIEKTAKGYDFVYEGADCRVVYHYEPHTGTLEDFTVQIDESVPFEPALGGGVTVVTGGTGEERFERARGGEAVKVALDAENQSLRVVWAYPGEGDVLRIAWSFRIVGKALAVEVSSEQARISEFSLGAEGNVPFRKTFSIPYLEGQVKYLPGQNVFSCRYLDWTVSHASRCPQGTATYEPKTDGSRNALVERGYIAVSPNVHEVLPNIPHPP